MDNFIDKTEPPVIDEIDDQPEASFADEQATQVAILGDLQTRPEQQDVATSEEIIDQPVTDQLDALSLAAQLTDRQLFSTEPLATKLAEKPHLYEVLLQTRGGTSDLPTIAELCALGNGDDHHPQVQDWYFRQMHRLIVDVFDFLWVSGGVVGKIVDVIEGWDDQLFIELTGISKEHFAELCVDRFIVAEQLALIGQQLTVWCNDNRQPEDYIYYHLDNDTMVA